MIFRFGTEIALIGGEHDLLTNRHEGSGESPQVVKTRLNTMATNATTATPFSNMAMAESEITDIMRHCIRRGAMMKVRMITRPRLPKACPFRDDCYKESTSLYRSGVSYDTIVRNKLERLGISSEDWHTDKSNVGVHDDEINVIMANGEKRYISLNQDYGTWREVRYLHSDGREFTAYELGVLQGFLPEPSESRKQADAGIPKEQRVLWITPDVRNIMEIKQGETITLTHTEEVEVLR